MMNMLGGAGMGSAGTGVGAGPMMPGNSALSPQLMAMLQMMQGQGGASSAPGPIQMPAAGTPMANYIGAGGNPGMMMHPMMGAAQPVPGAAANPQQALQAGMTNPTQLMQLLHALKGPQGGVPATQQPLPAAQNPMAGASPGWLAQLFGGGGGPQYPGLPQTGAGGMT